MIDIYAENYKAPMKEIRQDLINGMIKHAR